MVLDTRLIGKVQQKSGALVHEANGLLQRYVSWHHVYSKTKSDRSKERLEAAEKELRIFLATKLKG